MTFRWTETRDLSPGDRIRVHGDPVCEVVRLDETSEPGFIHVLVTPTPPGTYHSSGSVGWYRLGALESVEREQRQFLVLTVVECANRDQATTVAAERWSHDEVYDDPFTGRPFDYQISAASPTTVELS